MTIRPTMISPGSTTPANHGSKYTRISCSPRKYQGAFDGFGVLVGLAGSSSGASTTIDQTVMNAMTMVPTSISSRTRYGQVCTLSGTSLVSRSATATRSFTFASARASGIVVVAWDIVNPTLRSVGE